MSKVRATQKGVYGGYERYGPGENELCPDGEIFEIDDREHLMTNADTGKPIYEPDLTTGQIDPTTGSVIVSTCKVLLNKDGRPIQKKWSWFNKEWMERVLDSTEVTFDYEPFKVPAQYRAKNQPKPVTLAI